MNNPKNWLDWVKLEVPIQCDYVIRYMIKLGFLIDRQVTLRDQVGDANDLLNGVPPDTATLITQKMRAAWNQKKNRDCSSGRKTYSFVMSVEIEDKLKKLAGNALLNKTLENLINHASELDDLYKLVLQEEKDVYKKEQEKKWLIQNGLNQRTLEILKYNGRKLEHTKALQKKTIEDLYFKVCKYEMILKEHKLETIELTPEQKMQVKQNQDTATSFYEKDLQSELRLFPKR